MGSTKNSEQVHLRVVRGGSPALPSSPRPSWSLDLTSFPYRPGELPESLRLDLDPTAAEGVQVRAAAEGVPPTLWLRAAVEAGRARDSLAEKAGCPPEEIETRLLEAARAELAVGIVALERYGAAILGGRIGEPSGPKPTMEVLLPSEMSLAWRMAATGSGLGMEAWVTGMVSRAPAGVTRLEAWAAAEGESLAAWCYAAFVASPESRRASAQSRT